MAVCRGSIGTSATSDLCLKTRKYQSEPPQEADSNEVSHRTLTQSDEFNNQKSRKRRRGIIEKRRRDRINSCLMELRRLVPTAFEKQGTQKLEKAEILQMTVDHLRYLHSKGLDIMAYDPQRFASDYHSMGFRECASEVARYLTAVEGMELHDPLRNRLISHLQYYCAQKLSAFSQWNTPYAAASSSWVQNAQLAKLDSSSLVYSVPHSMISPAAEVQTGNHFAPYYSSTLPLPPATCQASSLSNLNSRSSLCLSVTEPATSLSSAMQIFVPPVSSNSSIASLNLPFISSNQATAQCDSSKFSYCSRLWGSDTC